MTSAHLVSIQVLNEFLGELRVAQASAETEFEEMRRAVARHIAHSRATVEDREATLAEAVKNLRNVPDDESDQFEQDAVDEAKFEARRAREELQTIEDAGTQFLALLNTESHSLNNTFAAGQAFLSERIKTGNQYRSITSSSVAKPSATVASSGLPAAKMVHAETTSSAHFFQSTDSLPALPRRMQWVPIEDIDETLLPDDLEFKKASHTDMVEMMRVFEQTVLPALARDPSVTVDDFTVARSGELSPLSKSPRFAFECMLGSFGASDVIVVDGKRNGQIDKVGITSGRHRIKIAKELGWTHVPARVLRARHA